MSHITDCNVIKPSKVVQLVSPEQQAEIDKEPNEVLIDKSQMDPRKEMSLHGKLAGVMNVMG